MDTLAETGEHCADCAAGIRAAAELVRDRATGCWLSRRARFWERAAGALAQQAIQHGQDGSGESMRASLYRARIKILAAIHDEQAILDECLWWDALARAHCAKARKAHKTAGAAALLADIASSAAAPAAFERHPPPQPPREVPEQETSKNGSSFSVFRLGPVQQ